MQLTILNQQGQDTGRKAELNDEVFAIEPNEHVVYLDVKQYLANHRQGTAKSKERSEVSGSTRKLHKQKGGGGSRVGDINSPLLSGGARVFGPKPRDYRFKLNAKTKQLARRSALSAKAAQGQIIVVDDIKVSAPRTKEFVKITKDLNVDGKRTLFLFAGKDNDLYLAARNIPDTRLMNACDLNTYVALNNNAIVITEGALEVVNKL